MEIKHRIQFGCNADELAMKVLSGKKTAISSLYDYHYKEYKDIIKVNEFASILDSHNKEICIIQITKIEIVKFENITEEFSIEEGDENLENWKNIHIKYYSSLLKKIGLELTGETKLLCEWFTVVIPEIHKQTTFSLKYK